MRLFLARHGETVDNVAGIYAGSRDSPLTAHGVLQARRLGAHLAERAAVLGPVEHVFASDLRRAADTAGAVVDVLSVARLGMAGGGGGGDAPDGGAGVDGVGGGGKLPLGVVRLPELRERDFGLAEGQKFGVDLAAAGAESREGMRRRAERFVAGYLVPLFTAERAAAGGCVVVVAHGLILDSLLRVLLARFGPRELARLGAKMPGWSNTGYVELVVGVHSAPPVVVGGSDGSPEVSGKRTPTPEPSTPAPQQPPVTLTVVGVNVVKHLEGLKKTRGGIGSAQFDKRQRTVDSFFGPAAKKAKVERGYGDG
ncbi:histidine phosphatase superfamily [Chaetomium fimeti]|uniref:Histidine phosphatase superfamily n=1 Tax=Chaetomium fimeti TaxID=1854472 RepID=A0AAE0HBQ5_9PEZI|nr:histidine phosphatase superfamily [Chaetomium fimeti]